MSKADDNGGSSKCGNANKSSIPASDSRDVGHLEVIRTELSTEGESIDFQQSTYSDL